MIAAIKRVPGQPVKNRNTSVALIAVGMLALGATASEAGHRKSWRDANASIGHSFSGKASYYGNESGSRTASGQRFNQEAMTAAHRTLPFGTRVKVTHAGRSVVVTINDRGPFIRGRVLDLSKGAARAVGLTEHEAMDADELARIRRSGAVFGESARMPGVLGAELPAPADASEQERVLAWLGRDPRAPAGA